VPHIRTVAAAVVAAALALPAAASAHVTLQPSTAPADGFTRLDVRVPNERDDAATVKVDVQLPPGFAFVSYEPRPGWKVTVERARAEQPIEVEGGFEVDEEVRQITWQGGRIGPGEFVDFGLSLRMPKGEAGDKLTFKALQTYEDGDVVRWIGPEDADEPAPIVTLTDASSGGGHGAPGSDPDTAVSSDDAAGAAENASATVESDGSSDTLAIVALALAAVALVAAGASFMRRTR
jgi:periplasmic copper chaperone A